MRRQDGDQSTADAIRDLTSVNARILQAEEEGRPADLEPLLIEEFTIVRANGKKQSRQKFLKEVPANANRGRVADRPDVRVYGECAVFTGRVTTTRDPGSGRFWNTRLFVRDATGWRCAAWQVTRISDASPS